MDLGDPVSYLLLSEGTDVMSSDGRKVTARLHDASAEVTVSVG
jgi:hypothetical protein